MSSAEQIQNTGSDGDHRKAVQNHNPPTAPLPSPEEIQAALAAGERRPWWRWAVAGAAGVALVGTVYVTTQGESDRPTTAATPPIVGAGINPSRFPASGNPEARLKTSNVCEAITVSALRKGLLGERYEKTLPDDYVCAEGSLTERGQPADEPLWALDTMSGKPKGSATWAHPTAALRRIEVQVVEDQSISGTSLFGNIAAEYPGPRSEAQTINGYPARFIPELSNSIGRTAVPKGIRAMMVSVPTTEGPRDLAIAVVWGGMDVTQATAPASQQMESAALTSMLPELLPNRLPPVK